MKIFLIGFMGSGKSYWGHLLSQRLEMPFFDLDMKIEEEQGTTISKIFEEKGEENFRRLEKDVLHLLSESHESFIMATGGGTPCYFTNIDYMKAQGLVIWIHPSIDQLYERLRLEKQKRPLLQNIPDSQLKDFIQKKMADRRIYYQQANLILEEDTLTLDHLLDKIFTLNH